MDNKKKTSPIWQFFTPTKDNFATCDICRQSFSYKTSLTNLKRHCERKHPTIKLVSSVPRQPQKRVPAAVEPQPGSSKNDPTIQDEVASRNITEKDDATADIREDATIGARVQPTSQQDRKLPTLKVQQTMGSYIPRKMSQLTKKQIDDALLLLFITDFQPFSIVEDRGFKAFVKKLNPTYELPSRKTISKTLIPLMYEKCKTATKEAVAEVRKTCVTTDCWTSINHESFMAATAHYIDDDFKTHSVLLECAVFPESHSSVNLANGLKRIVTEWGLDKKILLAVSDNASNIKNAISNELQWKHFGCFAHTINLIVTDSFKNDDTLVRLLENVKKVVSHFRRSSTANSKLMNYQKNNGVPNPKKLIQEVQTRWNSTLHMIERFVELEDAIKSTIAILDAELPILSLEEWATLRQLAQILKPFDDVTREISGEKYMTGSLVIVLTGGLVDVCDEFGELEWNKQAEFVLKKLRDGINIRLGSVEFSNTLSVCTFLDPRFKNIGFKNDKAVERVKKAVINLISDHISNVSRSSEIPSASAPTGLATPSTSSDDRPGELSVWTSFDCKAIKYKPQGTASSRDIMEVQRYLEDGLVDRKSDPLVWWAEHRYSYPNLSEIVKERFCALGSSVPCERLFSTAGNILTQRRSRLSSRKVEQLLNLNINHKYSQQK